MQEGNASSLPRVCSIQLLVILLFKECRGNRALATDGMG